MNAHRNIARIQNLENKNERNKGNQTRGRERTSNLCSSVSSSALHLVFISSIKTSARDNLDVVSLVALS